MTGSVSHPTIVEGSHENTAPWSAKFTPLDDINSTYEFTHTLSIPPGYSQIVDVPFWVEDCQEIWRKTLDLSVSLNPNSPLSGSVVSRTRNWSWHYVTAGTAMPMPQTQMRAK